MRRGSCKGTKGISIQRKRVQGARLVESYTDGDGSASRRPRGGVSSLPMVPGQEHSTYEHLETAESGPYPKVSLAPKEEDDGLGIDTRLNIHTQCDIQLLIE